MRAGEGRRKPRRLLEKRQRKVELVAVGWPAARPLHRAATESHLGVLHRRGPPPDLRRLAPCRQDPHRPACSPHAGELVDAPAREEGARPWKEERGAAAEIIIVPYSKPPRPSSRSIQAAARCCRPPVQQQQLDGGCFNPSTRGRRSGGDGEGEQRRLAPPTSFYAAREPSAMVACRGEEMGTARTSATSIRRPEELNLL